MPVIIADPNSQFSSQVVDKLIADQNLFLAEQQRVRDIATFLQAVANWKNNAKLREALGLTPDPAPVPPADYTLPVEPPVVVAPPSFVPVVQPKSKFGIYPAPGDSNPAGTVIANPYVAGQQLVKVIEESPFGKAHFWEPLA